MTLHNQTDLFNAFTHENIPPNDYIDFMNSMMDVRTSDGSVEQGELMKFVQNGLALSDEARTKYASEGKMHVTALKFFDSVKEKMIVHAYLLEKWPQLDVSMAGYLTPAQTKLFSESESESRSAKRIVKFSSIA